MPAATGLTYNDLASYREHDERHRYELIDGELHVSPSGTNRHSEVATWIAAVFVNYVAEHGGRIFCQGPDVHFDERNVVVPDVTYVHADRVDRLEPRFLRTPPDLVVEVSSPSTRRVDLGRKLALYQERRVPEYWFVDLDADQVRVHRLDGTRYAAPLVAERCDRLTTPQAPGLEMDVDWALGDRD